MTLVRDLVQTLAVTEPGRPRVTWYGTGGERVELSGRVLANWVVKATNLLVDEADAGPGRRVAVDLPVHWRTLVWSLATWTTGAEVTLGLPPGAESADVLVTDRPDAGPGASEPPGLVIAVPLPALALRYDGPLPAGVVDGAADLPRYPDALGWLPPVDRTRTALSSTGGVPPVSHGELLDWARTTAASRAWPAAPRVLLQGPDAPVLLATALAAWAANGSLVLLAGPHPDVEHVAYQERVSLRH